MSQKSFIQPTKTSHEAIWLQAYVNKIICRKPPNYVRFNVILKYSQTLKFVCVDFFGLVFVLPSYSIQVILECTARCIQYIDWNKSLASIHPYLTRLEDNNSRIFIILLLLLFLWVDAFKFHLAKIWRKKKMNMIAGVAVNGDLTITDITVVLLSLNHQIQNAWRKSVNQKVRS